MLWATGVLQKSTHSPLEACSRMLASRMSAFNSSGYGYRWRFHLWDCGFSSPQWNRPLHMNVICRPTHPLVCCFLSALCLFSVKNVDCVSKPCCQSPWSESNPGKSKGSVKYAIADQYNHRGIWGETSALGRLTAQDFSVTLTIINFAWALNTASLWNRTEYVKSPDLQTKHIQRQPAAKSMDSCYLLCFRCSGSPLDLCVVHQPAAVLYHSWMKSKGPWSNLDDRSTYAELWSEHSQWTIKTKLLLSVANSFLSSTYCPSRVLHTNQGSVQRQMVFQEAAECTEESLEKETKDSVCISNEYNSSLFESKWGLERVEHCPSSDMFKPLGKFQDLQRNRTERSLTF